MSSLAVLVATTRTQGQRRSDFAYAPRANLSTSRPLAAVRITETILTDHVAMPAHSKDLTPTEPRRR